MLKLVKDNLVRIGFLFTAVSAIVVAVHSWLIYDNGGFERVQGYLYDCGVDAMGTFVCAALFYGSMRQEGEGARIFRFIIVLISANFLVNAFYVYTAGVPEQRTLNFALVMLNKLLDLVMIDSFYRYVRLTLDFKGKLAAAADKILPILCVLQTMVQLSNIFYPLTFEVDANGVYHFLPMYELEDIYLITASALATILIIRSDNPRNQKSAALTFVFFPLAGFFLDYEEYGNAADYGLTLMALIIMYCVIFNYNSTKLASTEADLNTAMGIQTGKLPKIFPEGEPFDLRASMNAAKEVGGDFYDFFMIDENRLCFVMADVSGKGMPAALFMMTAMTMIKDHALVRDTTSEIFTAVNARLCENNEEGMFVTAWIGILDKRTMKVQFTNAGHNYPVLLRKGKPSEFVEDIHGLFLAGLDFTEYTHSELQLEPGDRLYLYTDGVTEAHDPADAQYGEDRLKQIMESTRDASGEKVLESVLGDIREFSRGADQFDDITMMVVTIKDLEEPQAQGQALAQSEAPEQEEA